MARQVIWTDVAWNDLEETTDYIAKDSLNYAAAFVREVKEAARSLDILSERGRLVPEMDNPKIRELFVGSYRLIYQVARTEVHTLERI